MSRAIKLVDDNGNTLTVTVPADLTTDKTHTLPTVTDTITVDVAEVKGRWLSVTDTDYGATGDGATDDTAAIQACIDAVEAAGGGGVIFPWTANYYLISSELTVTTSMNIIGIDKAEIRTDTDDHRMISIAASGVCIDGLKLTGSGWTTWADYGAFLAQGIYIEGTSSAAYRTDTTIKNCELTNFNCYGIWMRFVDRFNISNNYIHDCLYSACHVFSVQNGLIHGNVIHDIEEANAANGYNCYGIQITVFPAAVAGTDAAELIENPNPRNITVSGNHVYNNYYWSGIGCKAAIDVTFVGNTVRECKFGFDTGAASNKTGDPTWASKRLIIDSNCVYSTQTEALKLGTGISCTGAFDDVGATTVEYGSAIVSNNYVEGCGDDTLSNFSCGIYGYSQEGYVVTGNIVKNCAAHGLYFGYDVKNLVATGNSLIDIWSDAQTQASAIRLRNQRRTGYIGDNYFGTRDVAGKTHIMTYGIHETRQAADSGDTIIGPIHDPEGVLTTDVNDSGYFLRGGDRENVVGTDITLTNQRYVGVNTTGAIRTITMPADPYDGQIITFFDPAGSWTAFDFVLAYNVDEIDNAAANKTSSTDNAGFSLRYRTSSGWHTI